MEIKRKYRKALDRGDEQKAQAIYQETKAVKELTQAIKLQITER